MVSDNHYESQLMRRNTIGGDGISLHRRLWGPRNHCVTSSGRLCRRLRWHGMTTNCRGFDSTVHTCWYWLSSCTLISFTQWTKQFGPFVLVCIKICRIHWFHMDYNIEKSRILYSKSETAWASGMVGVTCWALLYLLYCKCAGAKAEEPLCA